MELERSGEYLYSRHFVWVKNVPEINILNDLLHSDTPQTKLTTVRETGGWISSNYLDRTPMEEYLAHSPAICHLLELNTKHTSQVEIEPVIRKLSQNDLITCQQHKNCSTNQQTGTITRENISCAATSKKTATAGNASTARQKWLEPHREKEKTSTKCQSSWP